MRDVGLDALKLACSLDQQVGREKEKKERAHRGSNTGRYDEGALQSYALPLSYKPMKDELH